MCGNWRWSCGPIPMVMSRSTGVADSTCRKRNFAPWFAVLSGGCFMALKPSLNVLVAFCLTASAALFFFGTGLTPVWLLLWFAPIPVLWLAPRMPAGQAFLVAAAAYVLGGFNIWFYMSIVTPVWIALLHATAPA